MSTAPEPAAEPNAAPVGDRPKVQPVWFTVKVCPATVSVPARAALATFAAPTFGSSVYVTVPLPVPAAPPVTWRYPAVVAHRGPVASRRRRDIHRAAAARGVIRRRGRVDGIGAGEDPHPDRPSATVVVVPSDEGRVAVGGEGDAGALASIGPTAPEPTSLDPCWVQTPPLRVHTHAAPATLLSLSPPTRAVLPSAERDTDCALLSAPLRRLSRPAWIPAESRRRRSASTPTPPQRYCCRWIPPTRAVLPSAERATEMPCDAFDGARADELGSLLGPDAGAPRPHPRRPNVNRCRCILRRGPCCRRRRERRKCPDARQPRRPSRPAWVPAGSRRRRSASTPTPPQRHRCRRYPPTRAVLPSAERDTEMPWRSSRRTAPEPTSLGPCWVQTPPLRVHTHAAPAPLLSRDPPTRAVLPSAERDTRPPWPAVPTAPEPTSLGPCWVQTPPLRVHTHTAPATPLSLSPPTRAVLPSAETDTRVCWAAPTAPEPTSLGPCCENCARA